MEKLISQLGGRFELALLSGDNEREAARFEKIFGGRGAKTSVEGDGVEKPAQAYGCRVMNVMSLGEDWVSETEFLNSRVSS